MPVENNCVEYTIAIILDKYGTITAHSKPKIETMNLIIGKGILLYIIDSIILILLKAITYNLYIYNQRGVTQLINIYFFLCFYNLLSITL